MRELQDQMTNLLRCKVRRALRSVIVLGVTGACLGAGPAVAQANGRKPKPRYPDPHTLATGTRTERAGVQSLQNGDGTIYVPSQCVGAKRCPLLFHHQPNTDMMIPVADKYGIIVSAGGAWTLDNLKHHLQQFAIDPDKIAILGHCAGMPTVLTIAANNLHVFSRVIMISGQHPAVIDSVDPPNGTTEFWVEYGILDDGSSHTATAGALRSAGHRVKEVIGFRPHAWQAEDFDYVGHWLTESWTMPDPADRPTPATFADVLLTPEAVTKMTKFWTRFQKEPEWIRTLARWHHQREVAVSVEDENNDGATGELVVRMVDIPAMAAKFPSVARLLKRAGLTAQQHEEYRMALLAAVRARHALRTGRTELLTTSVLGQNAVFLNNHPDVLQALEKTRMWFTP